MVTVPHLSAALVSRRLASVLLLAVWRHVWWGAGRGLVRPDGLQNLLDLSAAVMGYFVRKSPLLALAAVLLLAGCNQEAETEYEKALEAQAELEKAREQAAERVSEAEEEAVEMVQDAREEAKKELRQTREEAAEMVRDAEQNLQERLNALSEEPLEPAAAQPEQPVVVERKVLAPQESVQVEVDRPAEVEVVEP